MAEIIWNRRRNPTRYVSNRLGIERWQLRAALHKIKARSNLAAIDRVILYDDGTVTDQAGDYVGNVFDEI